MWLFWQWTSQIFCRQILFWWFLLCWHPNISQNITMHVHIKLRKHYTWPIMLNIWIRHSLRTKTCLKTCLDSNIILDASTSRYILRLRGHPARKCAVQSVQELSTLRDCRINPCIGRIEFEAVVIFISISILGGHSRNLLKFFHKFYIS